MTNFTVQDMNTQTMNRGLFASDMQTIHTAKVKMDSGDWIGVSRWHDEELWIADCAFGANGYPHFSNGTGTRLVAVRPMADHVQKVLNAVLTDSQIPE